jgi:hypothetical protein
MFEGKDQVHLWFGTYWSCLASDAAPANLGSGVNCHHLWSEQRADNAHLVPMGNSSKSGGQHCLCAQAVISEDFGDRIGTFA